MFDYGNKLYKEKKFDKALVIFENIDTNKVDNNKFGNTVKFLKVFWIANCNYNYIIYIFE